MTEIPMKQHKCQAVESLESLSGKVDLLSKHIRSVERHQQEEINRIWIRIAIITAAVVAGIEGSNIINILLGGLL